jgi:hypothetical protein
VNDKLKYLKTLKNCIRGWLPEESNTLSRDLKIEQKTMSQKITTLSAKIIGGLALGTGIMSFVLLTVPYYLFPDSYVPKGDPSLGYTTPNSAASWVVLSVAIGLIFLSMILLILFSMRRNNKGSQWGNADIGASKYTNNSEAES